MYRVPVNVGDEFETTIEAVGDKGDGIAKKEGFILFVPGVKKGDKVRIRVVKVLKKVGFAEVIPSGGAAEAPVEEAPAAEEVPVAEEAPEDTEDFGEEAPVEEALVEEKKEEAPEEEPKSE